MSDSDAEEPLDLGPGDRELTFADLEEERLNAILSTENIPGCVVLKFGTSVAAQRRWRSAIAAGNQVAQLGTASVEERDAFTRELRDTLLRSMRSPARVQPVLPQRRTDSISIPSSLRTPPSSPIPVHVGPPPNSPTPAQSPDRPRRYKTETRRPPFAPAGWVPPNAYTPPIAEGLNFRPRVAHADVLSAGSSRSEWYVALKSRNPGIYKSWEEAEAANAPSARQLIAPGFHTYAAALASWCRLRAEGEIVVYAPQAAYAAYHDATSSGLANIRARRSRKTKGPTSRGRGGRKVAKSELKTQRDRVLGLRRGHIKSYQFSIVLSAARSDPSRTLPMQSAKSELWEELHRLHLRSVSDWQDSDCIYLSCLQDKLFELESQGLEAVCDRSESLHSSPQSLHGIRRLMCVVHQEEELLSMDDAQARAVGIDGAFVALGRCIEKRSFADKFGWWTPQELRVKYGITSGSHTPREQGSDSEEALSIDSDHESSVSALFAEGRTKHLTMNFKMTPTLASSICVAFGFLGAEGTELRNLLLVYSTAGPEHRYIATGRL
ncbi:hypothetical protein PENSPDRAFT_671956 [Peniophora sp. CONT]|nr:hypothetical protein PENSPDRAFT_671956 [Peniophora sp. CONT]